MPDEHCGVKEIDWDENNVIHSISNCHDVFKINPNTGESTYSVGPYKHIFHK